MTNQPILAEWQQASCVLATMHGKERVLAPLLATELGITAVVPSRFDTDRFGTFTREIPRIGDQLAAARKKTLAAVAETGARIGIASEGSFGPDPVMPWTQSNLELVILIDTKHNLEIVGHHRSYSVAARGQVVMSVDEALNVARGWGFPSQGVIVRRHPNRHQQIYKELVTDDALYDTCKQLLSSWWMRSIYIETDMRAHRCPARMESIKHATIDLITNCKSVCPQCQTPGFIVTEVIKGLPCGYCGMPTDIAKTIIRGCQKCLYTEQRAAGSALHAEPAACARCNP